MGGVAHSLFHTRQVLALEPIIGASGDMKLKKTTQRQNPQLNKSESHDPITLPLIIWVPSKALFLISHFASNLVNC